jgi:hypothetical protein
MVATDALRESYTFPAQDVRQGHLGFLLAWLDGSGDRDGRYVAAMDAEKVAISTTLDPAVERDETERLVTRWQEARDASDEAGMKTAAEALNVVLARELEHRWGLTRKAIEVLRSDPRRINGGVETLVKEGLKEQWYQHTRIELKMSDQQDGPAFVTSPETDRYPAAAGSRYQVYLSSDELRDSELLHDDLEMQAEALATGDAFRGEIVDVYDVGQGRKSEPVWIIKDPVGGQLRIREGAWVCVVGLAKRIGVVERIDEQADGSREFEVWITEGKTTPDKANDPSIHKGNDVVMVKSSAHQINRRKSQRIWSATTPGAWLTHARPQGPRTKIETDLAEALDEIGPVVSSA